MVIRDVDDTEIIEVALVENIQRKDLGPFEEAEAMASLADRCGYTHEDLAQAAGEVANVASRSRWRWPRCPTRSEIFVGWPTFPLSHCFYR